MFVNIISIRHGNGEKNIISTELSRESSAFTLGPDFVNLSEISNKFDMLVETLARVYEWKYLFLETGSTLNYIKHCERDSLRYVYVYVRSDFEDFDILEKYDFIITEKVIQGSSGKIVFDGETLLMGKYTVRFISKPMFNKFEIDLDGMINDIDFEVPYKYQTAEVISHRIRGNRKYNVYFRPSKIRHFLFLKLLSNISWLDGGAGDYIEEDILTRIYNEQNI